MVVTWQKGVVTLQKSGKKVVVCARMPSTYSLGVKILEFKCNRRHQDFAKSKIYTNHSNQNIFGGGNFLGVQIRGGVNFFGPRKC